MRVAMGLLMFVVSLVAFYYAFEFFRVSVSAVHEIEALMCVLIGVVALSSAAISFSMSEAKGNWRDR